MTNNLNTAVYSTPVGHVMADVQKKYDKDAMTQEDIMAVEGLGGLTITKKPISADGYASDYFGLFWEEKKLMIGTCKAGYRPIQPIEMVSWFMDPIISRDEAVYDIAGVSRNGVQWFAKLSLNDAKLWIRLPGGDDIRPQLLLVGYNNGLNANLGVFTNDRIICRNTLEAAIKRAVLNDTRPMVTFPHILDAKSRIEKGHEILGLAAERVQIQREFYTQLTKIKFVDATVGKFVKYLFPSTRDAQNKEATKPILEKRDRFMALFDEPENYTAETEGTLWHLFNWATSYTTKSDGQFSNLIGPNADIRTRATEFLVELATKGEITLPAIDDISGDYEQSYGNGQE